MPIITLAPSPSNPGIEIVEGLTIKRDAPYSATSVMLEFSPCLVEHEPRKDEPGVEVRQFTVSTSNDETVKHLFDLKGVKKHAVQANDETYDVELVNITGEAPFFEYDLNVVRR